MSQQELELPQGWIKCKIDEITQSRKIGLDRSRNKQFDSGIPYLKMNNISTDGKLDLRSIVYVNCSDQELENFCLKKNDILFNTRNSYELVGKTTIWDDSIQNCVYNNNIMRIRIDNSIRSKFLFYFMNSSGFRNALLSVKKATTNICAIYDKDLKEQLVIIPPLNEQKRIVSKIEELFSKIDSAKQSLEYAKLQLEQYRQSLLKSAFEGKHTEKWESVKLESITEKILNTNPKDNPDHKFKYCDIASIDNTNHIIVNPKNFLGKDAPSRARQIIHQEDVIFSTVRTYLRNFAIVPSELNNQLCSTGFCVLRGDDSIITKLIFYLVQTIQFENYLNPLQRGTSYPAVRNNDILNYTFLLPSLDEQKQIVSQIEQGFSIIENTTQIIESSLQNLQTMKTSILKQAFEGKLVPQDPNDEPASVLLERIKSTKESQITKQRRTKNVK